MAAHSRTNTALALVLVACLAASAAVLLRGALREEEWFQGPSYPGPIVGIDIGATNSRVGISRNGTIDIVATVPSYLYFSEQAPDTPLVGAAAKSRAATHPKQTVYGFSALLGRRYDEPQVQRLKESVPYDIIDGGDGNPYVSIQLPGPGPDAPTLLLQFSPEELTAMLIKQMLEAAEAADAGERVHHATLSFPADDYDTERISNAMRAAGTMAGIKSLSTIQAPHAAVLAHDLLRKPKRRGPPGDARAILVVDVGGRSTSASIILIESPVGAIEIAGVSTDEGLGGGSFDRRVADYFAELIRERSGRGSGRGSGGTSRPEDDPVLMDRLLREAERAKRALSARREVRVEILEAGAGGSAPPPRVLLNETLTRAKFEELNADLFDKVLEQVHKAQLRLADVIRDSYDPADMYSTMDEHDPTIGRVVLAGGSAQIPKLRALVREFFAAGGGDAFRAESIGSGGGGSGGKDGARDAAARDGDGKAGAATMPVAFFFGRGGGGGGEGDEGDGGEVVVRGAVVRARLAHEPLKLEDLGCCIMKDMSPCPGWIAAREAKAAREAAEDAAEEAAEAAAAAAAAAKAAAGAGDDAAAGAGAALNGPGMAPAPALIQV